MALHVFAAIQRSCPTNMVNNAIAVNAAHKLRFAQDLALYNLDLSEAGIGFDGEVHRDVWQNDPAWQRARENVERLTAVGDWAEVVFATNVVYESLVGVLFRSHLRHADRRPQRRLRHSDHRRRRRERLQPGPRATPGPVLDARPRTSNTGRRTKPLIGRVAGQVDPAEPGRRPYAAAGLVAARREDITFASSLDASKDGLLATPRGDRA